MALIRTGSGSVIDFKSCDYQYYGVSMTKSYNVKKGDVISITANNNNPNAPTVTGATVVNSGSSTSGQTRYWATYVADGNTISISSGQFEGMIGVISQLNSISST